MWVIDFRYSSSSISYYANCNKEIWIDLVTFTVSTTIARCIHVFNVHVQLIYISIHRTPNSTSSTGDLIVTPTPVTDQSKYTLMLKAWCNSNHSFVCAMLSCDNQVIKVALSFFAPRTMCSQISWILEALWKLSFVLPLMVYRNPKPTLATLKNQNIWMNILFIIK